MGTDWKMHGNNLGLRPHATQGTRPSNNYNALLTIKNTERHVCNLGLRPHATQGTRPPIKLNVLFTKEQKRMVCKH